MSTKILVAIDFSEDSERALAQAIELASRLDAELDLVHVETVPTTTPTELASVVPLNLHLDEAKRMIGELEARVSAAGVTARTHLRVGAVVMGLLDSIEQLKPALVVVGSHGKGAMTRMLLGSVSESLVRRSPAPVLVMPSPKRKRAAERAAWSCSACGHILGRGESTQRCKACGASPMQWISAPITDEPIDAVEPHVGEVNAEHISVAQANAPTGLFATSPAGVEGYDVNPELRVRY